MCVVLLRIFWSSYNLNLIILKLFDFYLKFVLFYEFIFFLLFIQQANCLIVLSLDILIIFYDLSFVMFITS